MANTTHQNRRSPKGGSDDYPTPPWATRAFLQNVLPLDLSTKTCWEPAANRGHMVKPLRERFGTVIASDFIDYGAGYPVVDFLNGEHTPPDVDWIITNPPFNRAEAFVHRALGVAREGVAVLVRSTWAEGKGRYNLLFNPMPPAAIAQYVERVPIVAGRLDEKAVSNMPYSWFVWYSGGRECGGTRFVWIPPSRKDFEREEDYL
jgi:hypothetical protein